MFRYRFHSSFVSQADPPKQNVAYQCKCISEDVIRRDFTSCAGTALHQIRRRACLSSLVRRTLNKQNINYFIFFKK